MFLKGLRRPHRICPHVSPPPRDHFLSLFPFCCSHRWPCCFLYSKYTLASRPICLFSLPRYSSLPRPHLLPLSLPSGHLPNVPFLIRSTTLCKTETLNSPFWHFLMCLPMYLLTVCSASTLLTPWGHILRFAHYHVRTGASLVAQLVKNLPAMQETWVQSLGWEDPLE